MIGMVMTNASALVAPTFSKERMLGTNPICVAVPAGEEPAFIADLATTTAANGKLEILQRKGSDAPLGWMQDQEGHPIQDAHALKNGGALLPLGVIESMEATKDMHSDQLLIFFWRSQWCKFRSLGTTFSCLCPHA